MSFLINRFKGCLLITLMTAILCFFCLQVSENVSAQESVPDLMQSAVLKHRILVMDLTEDLEDYLDASTIINIFGPQVKLPKRGQLLSIKNRDQISEKIKTALFDSELIRIIGNPFSEGKKEELDKAVEEDKLDLVLFIKYSQEKSIKEVYFQLTEADSGNSIKYIEAKAQTFDTAIRKAMTDLEEELFLLPWRCKVIALKEGGMIINRGRLDGLLEDLKLIGYSINSNKKQKNDEPMELMLMKYGKKEGLYRVTELQRHYSVVIPDSNNKILSIGDILELPEIRFDDKNRRTRGSQTWDKIFNK